MPTNKFQCVAIRPALGPILSCDRTRESVMTMTHAAALSVKWNRRVDPPPCEHLNLEFGTE